MALFLVVIISIMLLYKLSPYSEKVEPIKKRMKGLFTRQLDNTARNHPGDIYGRLLLNKFSINMIKKNPMGIGIWNFKKNYIKEQAEFISKLEDKTGFQRFFLLPLFSHNEFLQFFIDHGWPGGILFLLLLFFFYKYIYKFLRSSNRNLLVYSIFLSQATITMASLISFPLHLLPNSLIFWFNISFIIKMHNLKSPGLKKYLYFSKKIIFLIGIVIFIILFYFFEHFYRLNRNEYYLSKIIRSGQMKTAEKNLEKLLNKEPDHKFGLYLKGLLYKFNGDYQGAIELFNKHPDIYTGFYIDQNIGECFHQLGRYNEALYYYKNVLKINPYQRQALNNIALIYIKKERFDDALLFLKEALSYYPGNRLLLNNLKIIESK